MEKALPLFHFTKSSPVFTSPNLRQISFTFDAFLGV